MHSQETIKKSCIYSFWAPDDGRRSRLKHVAHFTEINKLRNVASRWFYLKIKYSIFCIKECGRYSYQMVQDLKLSHTVNVGPCLHQCWQDRIDLKLLEIVTVTIYMGDGGTRWSGCVRNYSTSRKVESSIPDVTGGPGVESVSKIE